MNYKMRRQGIELGIFSLDELQRGRAAGEFSGAEYVQRDGMTDWQPLDFVLEQGYHTTPPPVPGLTSQGGPNQAIIWGAIAFGTIVFVAGMILVARVAINLQQRAINPGLGYRNERPAAAVPAASQPVVWGTNTLTAQDANQRAREFRVRHWLDGYEQRGQRDPACDAAVIEFLQVWVARNYGGAAATNQLSLTEESDKLANDPNCTDPLVLTVAAANSASQTDAIERYKRALAAYRDSRHLAYPQFYANLMLAAELGERSDQFSTLSTTALQLLSKCFNDGSFTPADQQEIGEIFVNGWAGDFFKRNAAEVCAIAHQAGSNYQWLALTLDGEHEINKAWAARGNGYADTVTEVGQRSFTDHLALARTNLVAAWNQETNWPLASERMIYVALGDSDIDEMRLWFDRTTTAQIDYNRAWSDFRWGLRPRWYGNEASLLALGVAAVNTRRFDTDVPRKYMDCIYDVESEMDFSDGRQIYGRGDIWPNLQRMYDGYLAAPSQAKYLAGWRTSYAVVAFFAKKYDVAREQLDALDWKPLPENLTGWNVNLSEMPLEVAARTGSLGKKIYAAELLLNAGKTSDAFARYKALENAGADERTQQFIDLRLASLQMTLRLHSGNWVDFLPEQTDDPGWDFSLGKVRTLVDGAVEVNSTPEGHAFYSQMPISKNFEVKGQFEVVHPSNNNFFQAGLNFGDTRRERNNWDSFRIRRYEGGDAVSIGRGWTKTEILRRVTLNDITNTFDFSFKDGCVTASVNGAEIFHQTQPPVAITGNSFIVGVGAFTRASTVIRYRNVQIRNLD